MEKKRSRRGFSLIELLIVVTIILIIAAIAIPKLLTVKQQANSTAAVANMKAIINALTAYSSQYSSVGYPATLTALAGPPGGAPTSTQSELLDNSAVANPKQGYNFAYTPGAGTPSSTFTLTADPVSTGVAVRHFFTDESGVIRYHDGAPATINDPAIGN